MDAYKVSNKFKQFLGCHVIIEAAESRPIKSLTDVLDVFSSIFIGLVKAVRAALSLIS